MGSAAKMENNMVTVDGRWDMKCMQLRRERHCYGLGAVMMADGVLAAPCCRRKWKAESVLSVKCIAHAQMSMPIQQGREHKIRLEENVGLRKILPRGRLRRG